MKERVIKHQLLSQAVLSISDGREIDWDDAERSAIDPRERQLLQALKVVAAAAMPVAESVPEPVADSASAIESRLELPPQVDGLGSDALEHWAHLDIRSKVAQGMFGEVYRAWDRTLGREVALKLLRADSVSGASIENTLGPLVLEEGRNLARVRHANVITVYGAGNDAGRVGLWMEYINGRTLEDLLAEQGRLGARQAALIGIDLCRALIAVHGAGLVHRDVKARNVMIEDGGRTVLMDFGAGQEMRPDSASRASTIAGTPYYMAPEVLKGEQPSRRSDIYSLGVLLYRLVTREYPVEGTSVSELRAAHENHGARLLRDARPDLPEAFVQVVEKALDYEPRDRFVSAGEMEQALVTTLDLRPTRPSLPAKRTVWRPVVIAAVSVMVTAGVGSMLWRGRARRSPSTVSAPAQATWRTDGLPACAAPGKQSIPTLVADGNGGAIVTWEDHRGIDGDIYAQRYDALGAPQWKADGIPICDAQGEQSFAETWINSHNAGPSVTAAISDGQGGAIITWCSLRSDSDIYCQRITASGAPASGWPVNGLEVSTQGGEQDTPTLATDGAGGAIVVWEDRRESGFDIYAQRVDASGRPRWEQNGVAVCEQEFSDERDPSVVADGAGGAIICWHDTPGERLRAQRLDGTGRTLWGEGITICAAPGEKERAMLISDGASGAIVTWEDRRSGAFDIYAQHIGASGRLATGWSVDGTGICVYPLADQRDPVLVADGAGGAIIVWYDWRKVCESPPRACGEVFAQRVDAAGATRWLKNGVLICSISGDAAHAYATSDGAGGAIIAWSDYRNGSPPFSTNPNAGDVYAQRIDASGEPRWNANGVAISTAGGAQCLPFIDSDSAGGAIVTWRDHRDSNDDIYVNRITSAGVAAAATPLMAVPPDIQVSATPGTCTAKVEFQVTAHGLPEPTIACVPLSGRDFPVGQTTVVCKATNSSGTATRTFVVTVIEPELPTIAAPPPVTVTVEPGTLGHARASLALGDPIVRDGCPGLVVTNDAPEVFPLGTTLLTWTATDASGNKAAATQAVTVVR